MEDNKLLTIVIVGRNDNHMGNFKYRLAMCINYTARNLKRIGCLGRVEILVTDWNSEIPLSRVLRLTGDAARIARFVYVPPEIASQRMPSGRVMNIVGAMNVSLRRGSGEFLMPIPADTLMPENSLRQLLLLLGGEIPVPFNLRECLLMRAVRVMPDGIIEQEPNMAEWDRYLLLISAELRQARQDWPGLGLGSIPVMYSGLWRKCRGYDEALGDWGWNEAELALRICQRYPWIELFSFGVVTYDMGHRKTPPCTVADSDRKRQNPRRVHLSFDVNDPNWGLGDYDLQIQMGECVYPERDLSVFAKAKTSGYRNSALSAASVADLTSTDVVEHIQSALLNKWIHQDEWSLLRALSWFSLRRTPRKFLEYGFCDGYASAVVAAACPCVEIYGVHSWHNAEANEVDSPLWPTSLLHSVGYKGYLRLITGDVNTAFTRLKQSFVGEMLFDIVVFRLESVDSQNVLEQICLIANHLSENGVLVVTSSKERLDRHWNDIRQEMKGSACLRSKSGTLGLFLKSSCGGNAEAREEDGLSREIEVDFGTPPNRHCGIFDRLHRRFRRSRFGGGFRD